MDTVWQAPADATVSEQDRAFFLKNGYLQLRGVFGSRECDQLIDEIWKMMPERFVRTDPKTWTGRCPDCCFNLPLFQRKGLLRFKDKNGFAKHTLVASAIHGNPIIGTIFEAITGRPCDRVWIRGLHPNLPMPKRVSLNEVFGNRFNAQLEKPERPLFKISRPPQVPIFGHLDAHNYELNFMIYLNDVPRNGGGLAVWPGSHHLFRHAFEAKYDFQPTGFYKRCQRLLNRFKPTILDGTRGDIVVVHNRLMHANSLNTSDRIRYGVLLDLSSASRREREQADRLHDPDRAIRQRFAATKSINTLPEVQEVIKNYEPAPVREFLIDHPRLHMFLVRLTQDHDPASVARHWLSRKVRSRRKGDIWLIASQDEEHRKSFKLHASGDPAQGRYRAYLNGHYIGRSEGGYLVQRVDALPGRNTVRLEGRFGVPHFVRVVGTSNPMWSSPIMMNQRIDEGAKDFQGEFVAPAVQTRVSTTSTSGDSVQVPALLGTASLAALPEGRQKRSCDRVAAIDRFFERAVFIAGMGRSGTTLLLRLFDGHPQMFVVPYDSMLLTHLLPKYRERGDFKGFQRAVIARLSNMMKNSIYWPAAEQHMHDVLGEVRKSQDISARPVFRAMLQCLALENGIDGKRLWLEKCPENELHLRQIFKEFPKARVVFNVRDPRAVYHSFKKGNQPIAPETVGRVWATRMRALSNFISERPECANSVCFVRYEDTLANPGDSMQRMTQFLAVQPISAIRPTLGGVPWKGNSWDPATDTPGQIDGAKAGAWRGKLTREELDGVTGAAAPEMALAGYGAEDN